ncbi:glycosyl transferase [Brevibacterium sp. UCMA 11754]|uniref:glycosyl transferase n=1 Tax=Brevibacterium sp. UCMA 11754 TaxID=2749198 RepID=UPI001F20B7BB|nr:glycosyl transferase [Brevibacterium sp. UCMA 11754]MCF2574229.1 glycosyl transferase [Brevibacterium sp. UCMA 11754]
MKPAVTVVLASGDDSSRVELETALSRTYPEIPIVDLGGLAVTEALALPEVADSTHLWFLTADSRPEPDCLEELLDAIGATESIAAVGPKIMHGDHIVSAGVTTTSAGARVNPVADGEFDQGQRDGQSETLGLDLPGMLISTTELERIGAPSRVLGVAYRGLEYSRRLRDLGRRVVVAPRAGLTVSAHSAAQLGSSPLPPLSKSQIRTEQRYRLSLATPGFAGIFCLLILTQLKNTLAGLLSNNVRAASWYFSALLGLVSDAGTTSRLRRSNARRNRLAKRTTDSHVAALYADPDELAVQRRSMNSAEEARLAQADSATGSGPGQIDETELNPVGDTEEAIDSFSRLEVTGGSGLFRSPLTYLLLAAAALSGFVSFRLFGPGHLVGGALGSTDVTMGDLVARLLSPHLDISTGAAVPADPYQLVLAALSVPFLGHIDIMARTLILLAPIVAVIAAYRAAGAFVKRRWVRGFAGLLWIAAPLFVTALSDGRLGVIIVWIAAPLFVIALRRSLRTGSIAAAAGAGLLLFLMIAGMPLMLPLGIILTVVLVCTGRGLRHLWLLAPTLFLAWPWLVDLVTAPGALFVMPGQTLAPPAPPSYLLAVGFPSTIDMSWLADLLSAVGVNGVSSGMLQLWAPILVLPMLILAFLTLIEAHLKLSHLMWAVGLYLAGLLLATVQVLIPAQTGPFHLIGSYPAAGLTLLSLGAIMLLTLGAQTTTTKSTNSRRLPMRGLSGLVAIAAVGIIIVSAGPSTTSANNVTSQEHGTVPALAADRAAGDTQARTLGLDVVDGEVRARLLSSADETVIGTSTIRSAEAVGGWPWERRPLPISEDQTLIAQAAAALSADDAGDVRAILGQLGVDFVLVDSDAKNLMNSVAAADGVVQVGPTESGGLWQVDTPYSGRFLVREPDGTMSTAPMHGTTAEVAPGEDGRTLIVSDSSDNITAGLDGNDLPKPERSTIGWASEYSLPASGGEVELTYGSSLFAPGVITGWILGLLTIIVAIPFGSQRQTRAWSRTTRATSERTTRAKSERKSEPAPEHPVEAKS